jgi:hypothetical protein
LRLQRVSAATPTPRLNVLCGLLLLDREDVDAELDFEKLVSERRLAEWQEAAEAVELPLAEWIVVTLDRAAKVIMQPSQNRLSGS